MVKEIKKKSWKKHGLKKSKKQPEWKKKIQEAEPVTEEKLSAE